MLSLTLTVVHGRPAGKSIPFRPGKYLLGRGEECHVCFKSDLVSRQHCQLVVGEEQALLRDLGSRNGTLRNGHLLLGEQPLVRGDQIQIGPVVFEVRWEEALPVPVSPAGGEVISGGEPGERGPLESTANHPSHTSA